MERFIRGGIAAAVLGGLLVAAGAALTVVSAGHQQFADQVLTGVFTVSAALRFTGAILMTWGIISLYLAQADRAGRLGLIAVVACMASMALQTGWIFCDLFAAPSFAHAAPGVLNNPSGPLTAGFMAAWLANTSFVLLEANDSRRRGHFDRPLRADAFEERPMHVGAMDDRVRIGEALAEPGAGRDLADDRFVDRVHHHQTVGVDGAAARLGADAERVEGREGIRRELDSGADLADLGGLLEDLDAKAALREGERGGEAADPGAGDDHGALLSGHRPLCGEHAPPRCSATVRDARRARDRGPAGPVDPRS